VASAVAFGLIEVRGPEKLSTGKIIVVIWGVRKENIYGTAKEADNSRSRSFPRALV